MGIQLKQPTSRHASYYANAGQLETDEAQDVLAQITQSGIDKKVRIDTIEDEILTIQQLASKEKRDLTAEEIAKIKEYLAEIEAINGAMLATYDRQMEIVQTQVKLQTQAGGVTTDFAASAMKSANAAYAGNTAIAQTKYDTDVGDITDAQRAGTIDPGTANRMLTAAHDTWTSEMSKAKQSLGSTQELIFQGLAQTYPEMAQQVEGFRDLAAQREEAQGRLSKNIGDYRQASVIGQELADLDKQIAASLEGLDRDFTEAYGQLISESAASTGQVTTDVANTIQSLAGMLTLVQEKGEELSPGEQMVLDMATAIEEGKVQVVDAATGVGTDSATAMDASADANAAGISTGEGYVEGILSQAAAAAAAGAALSKAAMGGMKKKAEIASPSKATRRFGQFTGDGYVLGMGDRLRAVQKMGAQLAAASLANEQHAQQFAAMEAAARETGYSAAQAAVPSQTNNAYNNQRTVVQHLTINSPKALSPAELARESENAMRRAAMGLG